MNRKNEIKTFECALYDRVIITLKREYIMNIIKKYEKKLGNKEFLWKYKYVRKIKITGGDEEKTAWDLIMI